MRDIRRRAASFAVALALAMAPLASSPVAAATTVGDDAFDVAEDQTLVVPPPGLLANDTSDDGTLCVTGVVGADLHGSIDAFGEDGSFTYSPPKDFNGSDTFEYSVALIVDGACSDTVIDNGTVTITVTPVNDAPTAANDSFAALADRTLNAPAPGVLGNDSDVDGDQLTAQLVTAPAHGVLTLAANGGFSYTPTAGFTGADAFSYRASDGTAQSQIRVVSLTVTAIPQPTPSPIPTPTAAAPTASPEASPSEAPLASDSGLATPSPAGSELATASAGPIAGPVAEGGGPPPLAILALVVLLALLAVAGVFFVRSQRAGAEEAYATGAYGEDFDEALPGDDGLEDDEPER